MTDSEMLAQIRGAFGSVARPAQFTNRDHCCECAEHDAVLQSRDHDSLRIEDVGKPGWDPICFVTDEGFGYWFPALARLALAEVTADHGWYFEQLLFHLTYEGAANRRCLAATPEQREAVAQFIRHVKATRPGLVADYSCESDIQQALATWGNRVSPQSAV
jgi:hypothetical protein